MGAVTLSQFLTLYVWFPLALLLVFLLLIARFYQRSSAERTYFEWFVVPILLLGAASARYASIDRIAGDTLGDLLMGVAGLFLIILCTFLYYLMTRNR